MNLKSPLLPLFVALILAFNIKLNAAEFIIENDTINKNYFDSLSYKTYSSPGGGYVSGNNAYNDRAKAQEFHAGNPCNIYGVLINFGFKNFQSLNDSSYIGINFYQLNGAGINSVTNTAACPGNIFHKDSIKVAAIDTINGNIFSYANPLFTDSNFAIGIDFDQLYSTDTVALYTNKDGDAGTREQSWEQDVAGNWVTLKYSWPLNVDFAIFPIVNTSVGLQVLSSVNQLINVWPNPSQDGVFNINVTESQLKNIQIYNSKLQLINSKFYSLNTSSSQIRFENSARGVYFVKIITENGVSLEKVIVN